MCQLVLAKRHLVLEMRVYIELEVAKIGMGPVPGSPGSQNW